MNTETPKSTPPKSAQPNTNSRYYLGIWFEECPPRSQVIAAWRDGSAWHIRSSFRIVRGFPFIADKRVQAIRRDVNAAEISDIINQENPAATYTPIDGQTRDMMLAMATNSNLMSKALDNPMLPVLYAQQTSLIMSMSGTYEKEPSEDWFGQMFAMLAKLPMWDPEEPTSWVLDTSLDLRNHCPTHEALAAISGFAKGRRKWADWAEAMLIGSC